MTHVDLVAKPLDIVEPKPESLVSTQAGKRSCIGQRVTEAAHLLRGADQCRDLFRCRRYDLASWNAKPRRTALGPLLPASIVRSKVTVFLGAGSTSGKAYAQIPGDSFRIKTETFWEQARQSDPIVKIIRLYAHALIVQIMQTVACNQIHSAVKRCARCLLTTHDQVQKERFPLTQEMLGFMLGIRRTGVSAAASARHDRNT